MKLSEKLAAIEAEDQRAAAARPAPGSRARPGNGHRNGGTSRRRSSASWDASKRKVRELVLAEVAPRMAGLDADALEVEVKAALDRMLQREDVKVSPLERRKFLQEMLQDTLGYGPLDPFLQDPTVTEIMCNGCDEIWVEREGRIEPTDASFTDDVHYRTVIDKIVSSVGRRVDEGSPMVDARLPDGSRVNAIVPPLAIHGAVLTVRKFAAEPYTVKDLVGFGTLSLDASVVLEACVRGKRNILVSGGTGTGKTTLLNVLSSFIPDGERVITIEDSAELQLQQPHVVNLEARPPNAEGAGEVRIRDLVRNALRMRPDRIVVGECRSGEALDMLQAMNTGHEGSMTTVHANSPRDALSRLETMVLMAGFDLPVRAIREQIVSALHLVVHLDRRPDGRRVVSSVAEIQGLEGDTVLMQEVFRMRGGELVPTGLRPRFADQLADEGIEVPAKAFRPERPLLPPAPPGRGRGRGRSRVPDVPDVHDLAEPERAR